MRLMDAKRDCDEQSFFVQKNTFLFENKKRDNKLSKNLFFLKILSENEVPNIV